MLLGATIDSGESRSLMPDDRSVKEAVMPVTVDMSDMKSRHRPLAELGRIYVLVLAERLHLVLVGQE